MKIDLYLEIHEFLTKYQSKIMISGLYLGYIRDIRERGMPERINRNLSEREGDNRTD